MNYKCIMKGLLLRKGKEIPPPKLKMSRINNAGQRPALTAVAVCGS